MARMLKSPATRRRVLGAGLVAMPALVLARRREALAQDAAPNAAARKVELTAADGHKVTVYRADPAGASKGGIVILHAVYGLAPAMGVVCSRWADAGYTAIAPALFDRLQRDLVHPYTLEGVQAGSKSYGALTQAQILSDIQACTTAAGPAGRVAISGFCTGGTWSWLAASKASFAAQVNFYGSHVHTPEYFDLEPRCPTVIHYGDKDPVVPMPQVERIRTRHPALEMHIYPGAVHAFLNPDQASYHAPSAAPAWQRSIAFMDKHVGAKSRA